MVFIFAGYKKPIEKLFAYNPGLPSRFPHRFVFADYTEAELLRMFSARLREHNQPPPAPPLPQPPSPESLFSAEARRGAVKDQWGNTWRAGPRSFNLYCSTEQHALGPTIA